MSLLSRNSFWRKFLAWPCKTSNPYIELCVLLSRNSLLAVTQSNEVYVRAWGIEAHPPCNERSFRRDGHFIKHLNWKPSCRREERERVGSGHAGLSPTTIQGKQTVQSNTTHRHATRMEQNESGNTSVADCGRLTDWPDWPTASFQEPELYLCRRNLNTETWGRCRQEPEQTLLSVRALDRCCFTPLNKHCRSETPQLDISVHIISGHFNISVKNHLCHVNRSCTWDFNTE